MVNENKKVYQYKKNTRELINEYNSIGEASRKTGIDKSNISKNCRRKIDSVGNYIFSFIELRLNNETVEKIDSEGNEIDAIKVKRFYDIWIDKIYDQRILLLNKENDKDVIEYLNSLNQFEQKLETIYHTVENIDKCYEMLSELKYEFMTWNDFREVVLKVETTLENMHNKNQYLLVDYDNM